MSTAEKLELVMELVEAVKDNQDEGKKMDSFDVSLLDLALDLLEDIIFYHYVMI